MPRDSVRDFYENLDPKFELYKGVAALAAKGVHAEVTQTASQYLKPGARVLDVGCGRGALALRLVDAGYKVDGCDIFDFCEVKDRIHFIHAAAENADFKGPYDAIFMVEFLIATESPLGLIRQYAKMIPPGGYLIISTANVDSNLSRAEFFLRGRHNWFHPHQVTGDGAITPVFRFQIEHVLADLDMELVHTRGILPPEAPPVGLTWTLLRLIDGYQRYRGDPPEDGQIIIYVAKKRA